MVCLFLFFLQESIFTLALNIFAIGKEDMLQLVL